MGGGQGWLGEDLLAIAGLALLVLAALRFPDSQARYGRSPRLWAVPAALFVLPVLQLLPLPAAIAALFPAHAALNADLATAGVDAQLHGWTLVPLETERVLLSLIVPAGLFMATAMLRRKEQRWLLVGAVGFAALSAVFGFWQVLEGPDSDLYFYEVTNRGSAVAFFANRNHLAALLACLLPVGAGLLIDRLQHHRGHLRDSWAWAYAGAVALLALGVTATQSRAGFVMLMLSVLACAGVMLTARRRGPWASARPWLQSTGLVAVILIVQYTLYGLLTRLDQDPLDDARWIVGERTIAAADRYDGLGSGLGTFTQAYYQLGDVTVDMERYVNHAHNDYLELWLEGGVPAMLLVAAALLFLGAKLVESVRFAYERNGHSSDGCGRGHSDDDLRYPGLTLGAAFAMALLALHSAVDYPLRTLAIASLAAVMAAVLATSLRLRRRQPESTGGDPEAESARP